MKEAVRAAHFHAPIHRRTRMRAREHRGAQACARALHRKHTQTRVRAAAVERGMCARGMDVRARGMASAEKCVCARGMDVRARETAAAERGWDARGMDVRARGTVAAEDVVRARKTAAGGGEVRVMGTGAGACFFSALICAVNDCG